ncbi:MAG: TetR/AcrR family transcriptional regulator, partial [Deltaproteobacteria bacterium]|nr:TetR/AcrR family transcriptional regulator [Deltaproteobacteria bacterium]
MGGNAGGTKGSRVQRKRRGSYHHGDLRRALVDAALLLIERSGASGVTLRGAARLAGVSQTAPYRHFSDKRALLAAVAEQGFQSLSTQLREASASHEGDPMGRLRALGVAYVHFAQAQPSHFRVMFGPQVGDRKD